jgi:N6-adenosine-specific RNA methylase IME4
MKKYNIIYADPPWTFDTYSEKGKEHKSAELHYTTMTMKDIQALPVANIAADDCVLFLWVTSPMLLDGLKTIETWGFTYKTIGFNWFKKNKIADSWFWGLGYWTRQNTELCLLATRGKPTRVSKGVHQVLDEFIDTEPIVSKLGAHSEKPFVVRERIVALCGDVPRIELFARQGVPGWDSTGLELDGMDIRDFLKELGVNRQEV